MNNSQRQQSSLLLYAFAGGFADALSFVLYRTFTGHVTGNLVLLAVSAAERRWHDVLIRALAVICFLLFTALGFRVARWPRSHLLLFVFQAAFLGFLTSIAGSAVWRGVASVMSFCCALGLQNGVVTSTLGVSIHSTFLSGDFTSLLKPKTETARPPVAGKPDAATRSRVLLLVLTGFFVGAVSAALLSHVVLHWEPLLLLVPLCLAAITAESSTTDR